MSKSSQLSATDWLLAGDPSIRWQTMRDLVGSSPRAWKAERRKVASEGWGQRLLARQRADRNWGQALYRPKWTCTTYTLQLLRRMGLPSRHPAALAACRLYLEEGLDDDGGINLWRPRRKLSETCVTGMVLSQLCHFGCNDERRERLVDYLLREQMPDGGWNCLRHRGAVHSSFHTTINVLEGLREYVLGGGNRAGEFRRAEEGGREFFLEHRLYRSSSTGEIVRAEMTRFHFPPRWHHDVMRTLDYFRDADAPRDERLQDAIDLVRQRRRSDGRWRLAAGYRGAVFFEIERTGQPSRWNTLRALRILRWWEEPEQR
jgi:hypothetical protein